MLKNCDGENWLLIAFDIKVIKLWLVMGAKSTTARWSFSTMRRIKTWLRSSMKQKRLNSLAILNFHKDMTDESNFVETGNALVSSHGNILNQFGNFSFDDEL